MKFIAVDWGSSSFRAWRLDEQGHVVDCVNNERGVFNHAPEERFEDTFEQACGAWLKQDPDLPVFMAGMVGSRNGWKEADYLPCPANADDFKGKLCKVRSLQGIELNIIPGLQGQSPSGSADVMRGEEVQALGALKIIAKPNALICLPGTHSKWVRAENTKIQEFSTFFTGEMFALLKQQSSIGALMTEDSLDQETFQRGVQYSRQEGGFLHHVFAARAQALTNTWPGGSLSSFLSGIAIGHEMQDALEMYPTDLDLYLVGNQSLQTLYGLAAQHFGLNTHNIDPSDAVIEGLKMIAKHHTGN